MNNGKQENTITIVCHGENNRPTGRLIFELGGIPQKEMHELREKADKLGKVSHAFAFYLDQQNSPKIVTHQMLFGTERSEKTNSKNICFGKGSRKIHKQHKSHSR